MEDDNTIHKLIEETLKKENYLVKNAYSGTEALTIIKNDNIDLILLDLMKINKTSRNRWRNRIYNNERVIIKSK